MTNIKKALSILAIALSFNAIANNNDSTLLNNDRMSIGVKQNTSNGLLEVEPLPWTTGGWGSCSARCDPSAEGGHTYTVDGMQYRSVSCSDPSGNCKGSKPSTSQSCKRYCYARNKGH